MKSWQQRRLPSTFRMDKRWDLGLFLWNKSHVQNKGHLADPFPFRELRFTLFGAQYMALDASTKERILAFDIVQHIAAYQVSGREQLNYGVVISAGHLNPHIMAT